MVGTSTPSPLVPLPLDSQAQLVSDLLNVLIGVASTTFPLNQVGVALFQSVKKQPRYVLQGASLQIRLCVGDQRT